jgi:hypothetical protein
MLNSDSIRITPEMLALLSALDEFKGAWQAFGTLAPGQLDAFRTSRPSRVSDPLPDKKLLVGRGADRSTWYDLL